MHCQAVFTSPRLRGEVGLRSNPGEGASPRVLSLWKRPLTRFLAALEIDPGSRPVRQTAMLAAARGKIACALCFYLLLAAILFMSADAQAARTRQIVRYDGVAIDVIVDGAGAGDRAAALARTRFGGLRRGGRWACGRGLSCAAAAAARHRREHRPDERHLTARFRQRYRRGHQRSSARAVRSSSATPMATGSRA